MAIFIGAIIFYAPNYFGHPDNSIPANPLVTPHSIVPEWYFLPFYAILRAIPSKAGGVLAMGAALLVFIPLPLLSITSRSNRFRPLHQLLFWPFVGNFLFLLTLGSQSIAQPFILLGQISTFAYFVLLALLSWW